MEYLAWKNQEIDPKIHMSNPLKIALNPSFDDLQYNSKERGTPGSKRRNVSDTSVGTPMLRKQIRNYLSSDCVSPSHFKITNPEQVYEQHKSPVPTSTSTSGRGSLKETAKTASNGQPDSFASYMEYNKVPARPPAPPGMDPYYPYYYQQPAPPMGAPPGMYQPQTYVPIYIPVMFQPPAIPMPQIPTYPGYPPNNNSNGSSGEFLTGRIKFFDSTANYGFFILDCNGTDLFVHYDDFLKSGMTKEYIQMAKATNMKFAFRKVNYYGKYNLSSKAVDIQLVQENYTNE